MWIDRSSRLGPARPYADPGGARTRGPAGRATGAPPPPPDLSPVRGALRETLHPGGAAFPLLGDCLPGTPAPVAGLTCGSPPGAHLGRWCHRIWKGSNPDPDPDPAPLATAFADLPQQLGPNPTYFSTCVSAEAPGVWFLGGVWGSGRMHRASESELIHPLGLPEPPGTALPLATRSSAFLKGNWALQPGEGWAPGWGVLE